jgi:protein-S-isoprenylcysteine O-methyltransferase Ste14
MITTPNAELLVLANLSGVFLSLGLYQLYRQIFVARGWRYDEGTIKLVQHAIGIPALALLGSLLADFETLNRFAVAINAEVMALGLIILNVAALFAFWSHHALGQHWSGDLETKTGHELVHSGPYRWIRHPQYSSYILISLGLFFATGNWLVSALVLSYFVAVAMRSWKEEEMLLNRLGEEYALYQNRTGRFLPKVAFGRH